MCNGPGAKSHRSTVSQHKECKISRELPGQPGKVMEFEWLISRPGEVLQIFKSLKSHGKAKTMGNVMEIYHNKNDILAQHKM